jgi:hypothetical protein
MVLVVMVNIVCVTTHPFACRMLNKRSLSYVDGPVPVIPGEDPFVDAHVQSISICDTGTSIITIADSTRKE